MNNGSAEKKILDGGVNSVLCKEIAYILTLFNFCCLASSIHVLFVLRLFVFELI